MLVIGGARGTGMDMFATGLAYRMRQYTGKNILEDLEVKRLASPSEETLTEC